MVRTTKISIAIDKEQLRRARAAAQAEGVSLSAYLGRALGNLLDEQLRIEAARELHSSWDARSVPTQRDRDEFLAKMDPPRRRRSKAA
jgi:hypothetical protein